MNGKKSVEKLLEDLERQLLVLRARKSELVFELLAEEFVEFRSSGRQFTKAQVVAALQVEAPVQVTASEFKVQLLSSQVALVTYRAQRHGELPVPYPSQFKLAATGGAVANGLPSGHSCSLANVRAGTIMMVSEAS